MKKCDFSPHAKQKLLSLSIFSLFLAWLNLSGTQEQFQNLRLTWHLRLFFPSRLLFFFVINFDPLVFQVCGGAAVSQKSLLGIQTGSTGSNMIALLSESKFFQSCLVTVAKASLYQQSHELESAKKVIKSLVFAVAKVYNDITSTNRG